MASFRNDAIVRRFAVSAKLKADIIAKKKLKGILDNEIISMHNELVVVQSVSEIYREVALIVNDYGAEMLVSAAAPAEYPRIAHAQKGSVYWQMILSKQSGASGETFRITDTDMIAMLPDELRSKASTTIIKNTCMNICKNFVVSGEKPHEAFQYPPKVKVAPKPVTPPASPAANTAAATVNQNIARLFTPVDVTMPEMPNQLIAEEDARILEVIAQLTRQTIPADAAVGLA